MPTILELTQLDQLSYSEDLAKDPLWLKMQESGWKHIGRSSELLEDEAGSNASANGFSADAFLSPKGEAAIAIRGTETSSWEDLYADLQLTLHFPPNQSNSAKDFFASIINKFEQSGQPLTEIQVTGHSLGGNLAQHIKRVHPAEAYLIHHPTRANLVS